MALRWTATRGSPETSTAPATRNGRMPSALGSPVARSHIGLDLEDRPRATASISKRRRGIAELPSLRYRSQPKSRRGGGSGRSGAVSPCRRSSIPCGKLSWSQRPCAPVVAHRRSSDPRHSGTHADPAGERSARAGSSLARAGTTQRGVDGEEIVTQTALCASADPRCAKWTPERNLRMRQQARNQGPKLAS